MARRDEYRGFAAHYDLHGWDWFASSHGEPLLDLLEKRGLAAGHVLDAGCGTGSLALTFARRGHRVTGMDLSDAMIEEARRKDTYGAVSWHRGDITDFDLPGRGTFDLVTCVADTLNHLPSLDEWEAAFRRFHAHLAPGGLLTFDTATIRGLRAMERQGVEEHEGRTLIVACIWEPETRRSTLKVTSFVPAGGEGSYAKATETITEWGQGVADVMTRLGSAGFADSERLWATSDDPENESRLVVLARRP